MFSVKVADIAAEARNVVAIELRDPAGGELPAFTPGAHLEFRLPNGLIRHYSLTNDNRERDRYVIATLRVPDSRGGSLFMHRELTVGDELSVSLHNHFELDPNADGYAFIAGGIGVTPIMAMVRWCVAAKRHWRLFYATRSRVRTAFYETLVAMDPAAEHVVWHFDDEHGGAPFDVSAVLSQVVAGQPVYCCGPKPLMGAVRAAALHCQGVEVRFESFVAPASELVGEDVADAAVELSDDSGEDKPFQIILKRSGVTLEVPVGTSILEVLEANGFNVPFSCREGQCGTCTQRVLDGIPDHRDYVLSDEERASNQCVQVCVSRALTPSLTLDL